MNDKREMLTDNEGKPTKVLTIHMLDNSSKSIVVDEATETVEVREDTQTDRTTSMELPP